MDSKTDSESFVIKGDICYSTSPQEVSCTQDGYLVCVDGRSAGVFAELPQSYADLPLICLLYTSTTSKFRKWAGFLRRLSSVHTVRRADDARSAERRGG